jgi:hypothetical protein
MSVDAAEWVVYQPPKSVSFGHQSRIRDPRRSWPMVQQFITDLTRSMLGDRIVLTCFDAELQSRGGVAASRVEEARRVFGPEDEQRGSYRTYPNWTLTEAHLSSAIEFALDDDKLPKQEVGPSWLSFSYQFCWIAFDHGSPEEGEVETRRILSVLGVTIGQQRLFLQPNFIYPAAWNSELLRDFIDRSESIMPFRFRDHYFQRWLPPQRPTSNGRFLRLEPTWRRGSILH